MPQTKNYTVFGMIDFNAMNLHSKNLQSVNTREKTFTYHIAKD